MIAYNTLRRQAETHLPPDVFAYYDGVAGSGHTGAEAAAVWQELRLRPRLFRNVADVTTETTLLGQPVSTPVAIAPTAAHGYAHDDAEVATARGAAEAGALLVLSTRASADLTDIAAAAGRWWMQIYTMADRGISDELARRAAGAGAEAIVLTVDTPFVPAKSGTSLRLPRPGLLPGVTDAPDADLEQVPVRPDDIRRLADITGLPVIAKGVLRGDEARRCVDAGAAAVVVSTHGGRQLDGVVPTAWALPEVHAAVGHDVEVYVDGGIHTGRDVLRALALGARSAWIGRSAIWALAIGGADGVADLLSGLTAELREAFVLAGCSQPRDAADDLVWRQPSLGHTVEE